MLSDAASKPRVYLRRCGVLALFDDLSLSSCQSLCQFRYRSWSKSRRPLVPGPSLTLVSAFFSLGRNPTKCDIKRRTNAQVEKLLEARYQDDTDDDGDAQ